MSGLGFAGVLAIAIAAPLGAQSTGSPVYTAPDRAFTTSEIALSLSDPGPGIDFEASYREYFSSAVDIGFRGGFHSESSGDGRTSLLLGTDLRALVVQHNPSFPLDGALTLGLGLETGEGHTVGFLPVGFAMGRRVPLQGSSVTIEPYLQPILMPLFGDATGAQFTLGFGVDARLSPRVDARFSAGIGDRDGVGFTVAYLR